MLATAPTVKSWSWGPTETKPLPSPGVYRLGEDLFRVRKHKYPHEAVHRVTLWEGSKPLFLSVSRTVRESLSEGSGKKLSVEEAGELGLKTGWCIVCGRGLSDPTSVAKGIGPVCIQRQESAA